MTDPLNESAEEVVARCLKTIDAALDRAGEALRDDDRAVLRRVAAHTFTAFCGALQDERRNGAHVYQMRAAALLVLNNVFWETVCVLTDPPSWEREAARFLGQLAETIKEGPGR
jgi:hypothetical protein